MHPNAFLKTYWRMELKPQVFVAMSFAQQYEYRFKHVIDPAIRQLSINGKMLEPYRVDLSRTGDSILTDIVNGIAHSQLVLADVSTMGKDSVTGLPYRNGNVMYEVGIALACRQPSEILLVRDDKERFLFDVSTIPHVNIDFTDKAKAIQRLGDELQGRLTEQRYFADARLEMAIAGLTSEEAIQLKAEAEKPSYDIWSKEVKLYNFAVLSRLLDKGLIMLVGQDATQDYDASHERGAYRLTPLGRSVAETVKHRLQQFGRSK